MFGTCKIKVIRGESMTKAPTPRMNLKIKCPRLFRTLKLNKMISFSFLVCKNAVNWNSLLKNLLEIRICMLIQRLRMESIQMTIVGRLPLGREMVLKMEIKRQYLEGAI